jgi:hypothetical protein
MSITIEWIGSITVVIAIDLAFKLSVLRSFVHDRFHGNRSTVGTNHVAILAI